MSKRLVQINVVCNGSTGRIMSQIQQKAISEGWEAYSFYGRGKPSNENCYKIGKSLDVLFHVLITRLFNRHGHGSKKATKNLIKQIEKINPDVIQLHNIHGYYINIDILFEYLKKCNKKIIWTLHDCWSFTGHCTHFTYPKCEKWKKECSHCPRKREYPSSFIIDRSKKEYEIKRKTFTGVKNLTIVTPSEWLKNLLKESFLKEYEVKVINNGIDLSVLKPTKTMDIKQKYNIDENQKIILGVAAAWSRNKGLDDFIELSKHIDNSIKIILVGVSDKQIKKMPDNIVGIKRTENLEELANLYTIADVLFHPSKEETFSLVTLEALACGTPVISFNTTSFGEVINNKNGICIDLDEKEWYNKIIQFLNTKEDIKIDMKNFEVNNMTEKYIKLYEEN